MEYSNQKKEEEQELSRELIDEFFRLFTNPDLPHTFKNANNAAIAANIPPKYRKNIFNQAWFTTGYGEYKRNLFNNLADEALHETLTLDTNQPIIDKEANEIIGYKRDAQLQGVKLKAAIFTKENLDRENYGKRIKIDNTYRLESIFTKLKAIESGDIVNLLDEIHDRK